jgi:hypothetical protein
VGRLVYARLDDAEGLKPGDFVSVAVAEPALDDVLRLPATALGTDGMVLALDAEGRLEALAVTLLRRQGDDVLLRAPPGAPPLDGRQIVAQRSPLLGPGIKARALGTAPGGEAESATMLELSEERRARLVAFVKGRRDMPEAERGRLLDQLAQVSVPADVVKRLETRMGG